MDHEVKSDPPIEASEGAVSTVAKEFVDARPRNPKGLPIAQARVAAELFGTGDTGGFGRLQLLNRLGAGGMGVIYAAYDPALDRTVAVKLLHVPHGGADTVAEAKALARLSHPNVVPIFDVGFAGAHVYIVMELVLGKTLRRWAARRSRHEILKAYRQAGEALVAAHEAGLVHRDFKPDNAIMGNDGRVRVVDFGLACEDANQTKALRDRPAAAGTPRYMAPEQMGGAAVTAAADQYSFCCSLAEALNGLRGGHGRDSDRSGLPRWLQLVIERGRKLDPRQRFPSMRELLQALAQDPAAAEALLVHGQAMIAMDDRVAAMPLLTEAFKLAFEAGMSSLAVEAWARRAWVRGISIGDSESLAGLDVVEAVAAHPAPSPFVRALLYNNVGGVEMALERPDRAHREASGFAAPGAAELLNISRNLGYTTEDPEARDRLLAEAEAETAKLLGGDHPQALQMSVSRRMFLASFAQASALLRPACAGLGAQDRNRASECWFELGFLLKKLGDDRSATAAMQRVSLPAVEPGSAVTTASAYLHL